MKTDVLFYKLFANLPEAFFQLTGRPASEAQGYRLEALEIKQTSYRLDGILRPESDDPEKPIYFLEVKAQPEKRFYQRFFAKIFDYYDQKVDDRPFYARAIFTERSLDPGVPVQYQKAIAEGVLERYYLEDLRERDDLPIELELLRLIVTPETEAIARSQQVLKRVQDEIEPGTRRKEVIESVETILVYKFPKMSRKELERMFNLVDIRETAVYREAFEEGKVEGEKQGKKEGKKEGKKVGKKEGRLDAVPLLLDLGVPKERIAEDLDLDLEAVQKVAARRSRGMRSPRRRGPAGNVDQ